MYCKSLEYIVFDAIKDDYMHKYIHQLSTMGSSDLTVDSRKHLEARLKELSYPAEDILKGVINSVDFNSVDSLLMSLRVDFAKYKEVVLELIKSQVYEAEEVTKLECKFNGEKNAKK